MSGDSCPFCDPPQERILWQDDAVFVLRDGYPVSPGHALVIPRRHVETWFDATIEEQAALMAGVEHARRQIESEHSPDGYNIGVNVGEAGGQTVFHLHVHVIPRYRGDVENPRGGVRHVIREKADYAAGRIEEPHAAYARVQRITPLPHGRGLIAGDDDPLLAHLTCELALADSADIAVAFVQRSGVELIAGHLEDLLARGGALRLVVGDYLGVTDPDALLRLLDITDPYEDASLRIFECRDDRTFHPKAYIIHRRGGRGAAFVGSSNLTRPALTSGVEWNYRVIDRRDRDGFASVVEGFERLFEHPATRPLTEAWVAEYRARRRAELSAAATNPEAPSFTEVEVEAPAAVPEPHEVQREALAALEQTRREGNGAGLVVLATGLGKTWLAAFDSARPEFRRILFVAHREEILTQAAATFRRIRPTVRIGRYGGGRHEGEAQIVMASIQTLARREHLRSFDRREFDYIVVDEFHHAHAATYRRILDYFEPAFLLGLTATPERSDGGDILALCQENLVYRCDLAEGIRRGLLTPFRYFGVPDDVDYANIPWRSARFDEEELTRHLATQARARNVLEQYEKHAGRRTLAFCCSVRHADFMCDYFQRNGVRAASVHSAPTTDPRALSLEHLAAGELDVVFAVDMFNEGIDVPAIDTVMMLRPTESRLLWLQQLGRGLRRWAEKNSVTVIDYIGNHRIFLVKIQALLSLESGEENLAQALERIRSEDLTLPPGCEVTYDLRALHILETLIRRRRGRTRAALREDIQLFYRDFLERYGRRPTAVEAYHEGAWSVETRRVFGRSWLAFLAAVGALDEQQRRLLNERRAEGFLRALETTPMTRSYKMVLFAAMLEEEALPGKIHIDELVSSVRRIVRRSAVLQNDFSVDLDDTGALRRLLEKNPIHFLCSARGTGGVIYLAYETPWLRTTFDVQADQREAFCELAREIVEWRMAEYLGRPTVEASTE